MATFDDDFGLRHAAGFKTIAQRTGLQYLPIDCGETPDGKNSDRCRSGAESFISARGQGINFTHI
jgi:hypothetical protein